MTASSIPLIGITAHFQQPNSPLYGLRPAYTQAVKMAGGAPVIVPSNLDESSVRAIFDRLDGIVLSGGVDVVPALYGESPQVYTQHTDPERDQVEADLIRWACEQGKPLLAICRGIQILNVVLGGNLYQDVSAEMPKALKHAYYDPQENWPRDYRPHPVQVAPNSRLATILGLTKDEPLPVNSLHHQGVKDLAESLVPTAHAPDGLIEAVELPDHPFALGVQWHPEELALNDPTMLCLFQALVKAASPPPRAGTWKPSPR